MKTAWTEAASIFLLQYGEMDQQGMYDFRHPLPVHVDVDTKVTGKEGVAAQFWTRIVIEATLKPTQLGAVVSVYNSLLQCIGYLRERK